MTRRADLPAELGGFFGVRDARRRGVSRSRLVASDLARPYRGVRAAVPHEETGDPWGDYRAELVWRARSFLPRLTDDQFYSHETAAAVYDAPVRRSSDARIDVTTLGDGPVVRARNANGHRVKPAMAATRWVDGLRVSSPATTWAMLGATRSVEELVQLGDFFCRVWRDGRGRPTPGKPPLAEVPQLTAALRAGRRVGASRLRAALELIRTDSWSPRETSTRLTIVGAGLPEPELNVDVYERGRFLGCVDLCYPDLKIAIEYQGQLHGERYAQDIERIERLRAAGWIVIQVSSALLRDRRELVRRVAQAIARRG